jgi:hypothetical protein
MFQDNLSTLSSEVKKSKRENRACLKLTVRKHGILKAGLALFLFSGKEAP